MTQSHRPFTGCRVLELGGGLAVPYATRLLAELGAEVVKLEPPEGDPLRRWHHAGEVDPEIGGPLFGFLNSWKDSVPLSTETARRLAAGADLVVDGMGPGGLEAVGLDPAALTDVAPHLPIVSVSWFGRHGPWARRPANDFVVQALVGSTDYRGLPGQAPYAVGGRLGEFAGGIFTAAAATAALVGGRPVHLDLSIHEVMMHAFQTYRPIFAVFDPGHRLGRAIEIPSVEPAADGWVGFCTITGQQWQDFCAMIGDPELGEDESLRLFDARMHRRDEVWSRIHRWTTARPVAEIVELAAALRIPCGPVGDGRTIAEVDHFVERGVFVEHPAGFTQPRTPFLISGLEHRTLEPAPHLAADPAPDWSPRPAPAATSVEGPWRPLDGLKVADFSTFWAGPLATAVLGVLGADVVKIESVQRIDGMRWSSGLRLPELWEFSPVFHGANAGKRDVTLDLDDPECLTIAETLIAEADIVVENYSPRVMENFGLGWERVHELNPGAVMVRMPAFGLDGPWRDRTGFAMTIEQVSGLAWRTGDPDGQPLVPRGVCDSLGSMHAVTALLAALELRRADGRGRLVEVPLVETGLNAAAEQIVEYTASGTVLGREGQRSAHAAPQGHYPSAFADQWVAVSVDTDEQWRALAGVIGRPDLADDEDLAHLAGRREHHDRLDEAIAAWSSEIEPEYAAAQLVAAGVPAAHVVNALVSGDAPQLAVRRFFEWHEHPVAGWVPYLAPPFLVDGERPRYGRWAPALGEHNDEILGEVVGLSVERIEALRERGCIGTRPVGT